MEMEINDEDGEGYLNPQEQKCGAGDQEPGMVRNKRPSARPTEVKAFPMDKFREQTKEVSVVFFSCMICKP